MLKLRWIWSLLCCLLLAGCAGEAYYRQANQQFAAGQYEEAIQHYQQAVAADPSEVQYKTTYYQKRDEAVNRLFDQAHQLRQKHQFDEAEQVYQRIQAMAPDNARVNNEIKTLADEKTLAAQIQQIDALIKQGEKSKANTLLALALADAPTNSDLLKQKRLLAGDAPNRLKAPSLNLLSNKPITLEFRNANLKMVFEILSRNTGINFIMDKDVRQDLTTTIFVKKVSLEDAVDLILSTSKLEKKILNTNTVMIYPDSADKTAEYQDLIIKSFYLTNSDAKRTAEMLKGLLKIKNIYVDDKINMLVLREPAPTIELAGKLIAMQDLGDPEVMLEVEVLEVKRTRLTELGVQFPEQVTLSPIGSGSSGAVLLSDLSGLNRRNTSITGTSLTLNAKRETGDANLLANPRIRARNKEKANILIGDKIPIITTTTTSTGVVSENIQYQDVGLKLDVEPTVYLDNDVGIKVGLEVSTLGTQVKSSTGTVAYQIGTRNASTILRLKDGETQVLAGLINDEDRKSANKVPGLGDLPILGHLFASHADDNQKTEIVLSITPHIIRSLNTPTAENAELWSGSENNIRVKPLNLEAGSAAALLPADNQNNTTPVGSVSPNASADQAVIGSEEEETSDGPTKAVLNWDSSAKVLKPGESTEVSLVINSSGGLRSLPLQLGFDPKLIQVSNVSEGAFFKQSDPNSVFSHTINAVEGKVYLSLASTNIKGAKGKGKVLTLTVTAKASGKAVIKVLSANAIAANDVTPQLDSNQSLELQVQ